MTTLATAMAGLTDDQKRKIRHTVADLTWDRNGYASGACDVPLMEDMVARGLMERGAAYGDGGRYYRCTDLGKAAVRKLIQEERDAAGLKPWRVYLTWKWDGRDDWEGRRVWAKSRSAARFKVVRDMQDVSDQPVRELLGYIRRVVRDDVPMGLDVAAGGRA